MSDSVRNRVLVLAVLLAVFVAFAGNFHFTYGAGRPLERLPKVSWSLSETVVNLDELEGLPAFVVAIKYPLLVQALRQAR